MQIGVAYSEPGQQVWVNIEVPDESSVRVSSGSFRISTSRRRRSAFSGAWSSSMPR
ncbi:hypothetical protein ACCAA_290012 [Candidatus Accumulibacter aalborgensis]|uniref:Uncharacterized protein n=1 Tax=Candidatus Accumulibacter aalborgensis TaxID=1860102 RepID=A0A1A8XLE7_9PROT|nr:hypothetical protein ACCAA_290012 [Candidatus Accumulibacter aalborgensis]